MCSCQNAPASAFDLHNSLGCPSCDHAAWLWALYIQTWESSLFVLWLHPKRSREANSPHPIKGILRHFTSLWSLAFGGNNMCFVPAQVCHEVCRGLCQGCAAPSQEGSQPLNTSELLNSLLEPCLLWCFPSAPGNDNHFECQPARNRWQQKIHSALRSRMSYLPWTTGLWTHFLIMNLGMPGGLGGNRSPLEQLARWFYFRKHRRMSRPHPGKLVNRYRAQEAPKQMEAMEQNGSYKVGVWSHMLIFSNSEIGFLINFYSLLIDSY